MGYRETPSKNLSCWEQLLGRGSCESCQGCTVPLMGIGDGARVAQCCCCCLHQGGMHVRDAPMQHFGHCRVLGLCSWPCPKLLFANTGQQ